MRANDATDVIMMARKMGMKMPIIGNNNFVSKTIYDKAKEAADNIVFTLSWSQFSEEPRTSLSWLRTTASSKRKPIPLPPWPMMRLRCGGSGEEGKLTNNVAADRIAFRDALASVSYSGAAGKVRFKRVEGGYGFDAERDVFTHIYRNGKLELYKFGFWSLLF